MKNVNVIFRRKKWLYQKEEIREQEEEKEEHIGNYLNHL